VPLPVGEVAAITEQLGVSFTTLAAPVDANPKR
jgi:hypothetical protein